MWQQRYKSYAKCPVCQQSHTKKPTPQRGRGLAVRTLIATYPITVRIGIRLLQVHSVFVRGRLLLGQAVNVAAAQ